MKRYRQLCIRSRQPVPPVALAAWLGRPATTARLAPPWSPHADRMAAFATLPGWDHDQRISPEGAISVLEDHLRASGSGAPGTEEPLRLLIFRHRQLARDLHRHAQARSSAPMVVAVTGASGLIGRA